MTTTRGSSFRVARTVCPSFVVRDGMKPLLNDLLLWCLSAPGRLDPSKGLWLWGDIGSGKTTMLHVILRFCRIVRPADAEGNPYGFRISNAIEVCSGYQRKGYDGIQTYIDSRRQAFDELGSETIPTGYYGNTENVFQYILQRRYDRRHTSFTHVTTNLSVDQIAEVYGARIYDRCKEMFNFVPMRGATFRKK